MNNDLRILIAAEHASARFGGEAALPLHYFRVLRSRGCAVWLVTHARTRAEISAAYPDDDRIVYIDDTVWHRAMWQMGKLLPARISYVTAGFLSRLSTQFSQVRIVRKLVRENAIDVVHQPMPVSPREPSMLFGFGVPVIIGPMNGGMDYPPAFRRERGGMERLLLRLARSAADALNVVIPGKRLAATLLVANERTRRSLPSGVCTNIVEMVENGVDLAVWRDRNQDARADQDAPGVATFVFMGRLVDWKAVDLLVLAFANASRRAPLRLLIIGDGPELTSLLCLAASLGVPTLSGTLNVETVDGAGTIRFAGWLSQTECAEWLGRADCLILPSLWECGGAVVLEAMALSKPVIATAWGGPLDYLDDTCGVLVPPTSHEALVNGLAEAMVRLVDSPLDRLEMGRKGREKVIQLYDWETKVDHMVECYRAAIRRSKEAASRQRASGGA